MGRVPFSVALAKSAERSLARSRHLALTVRLILSSPSGMSIGRSVRVTLLR
jgi:hypothetical protein